MSDGMLSMARSIASPDGTSISYEEGSAMAIPFPDETFDVVFCQHGLEFFPDRGQSLREMRRVLKSEGRLGLRVWSAFAHQPFHRAVLAALDRHHWGGQDVPSRTVFTQAFSLWETDELRTLVVDAGFRDIDVSVSTIPFRLGSSSTDILGYLSALPIRSEILEMEETARTAMLDEAVTALNTYVDEDKFVMPASTTNVRSSSAFHKLKAWVKTVRLLGTSWSPQ